MKDGMQHRGMIEARGSLIYGVAKGDANYVFLSMMKDGSISGGTVSVFLNREHLDELIAILQALRLELTEKKE